MKCRTCGRNIAQKINTEDTCKKCLLKRGLKFCPSCKKLLPLGEYHKNSYHNKHGHCSRCKKCRAQQGKMRSRTKEKYCVECGKELTGLLNIRFCEECKEKRYIKRCRERHTIYYDLIEEKYKVELPCGIVVHHINSDHNDNRFVNLFIFESNSAHSSHHQKLAKWAARFPFVTNDEARATYPELISNLKNFTEKIKKFKK